MISIEKLRKEYAGRCVLDIPELKLVSGCRYALLGANGSGKSTLLKIIAGVEKATGGAVVADISGKKAIGYLPQAPYGFSFSVLKNVLIALDRGPERKLQAMSALEEVGMSNLVKADASRLSGGETQRMAFARIISVPRKLLLLDEPTAAADLGGIDLMEQALLKYCGCNNCTVIFATHAPAQAFRLADEIMFLHQGKIVEQGKAQEVLQSPKSELAQSFLKHWRI